jgi:hypothetical protein
MTPGRFTTVRITTVLNLVLLWKEMVGGSSTSPGMDEEDWDGDPLAEGDPLASLVDRIAAVKTSFSIFSARCGQECFLFVRFS